MTIDENLLMKIINYPISKDLKFVLHFQSKEFGLSEVKIVKSPSQVKNPNKSTLSSNNSNFLIKAMSSDASLVPLFSKMMLGPNVEFQNLKIKTVIFVENKKRLVTFITNLINTIQRSSKFELNMVIIDLMLE